MADIRLISILPLSGVQPSPVSQGAGSGAPGILPQLPAGSVLAGFIINRDASGNPVLRTDSGDVTFHSDIFLRIGSEVVIRLVGAQGAQTARILSIDGQPPPAPGTPPRLEPDPDVILSPKLAAPPSSVTSQNAPTVTGTLVAPATLPPGTPVPPAAGTQIAFKITPLPAQQQTPSPAAPAFAPAPATPAPYAAYARAVATPPHIPPAAVTTPTVTTPPSPIPAPGSSPAAAAPPLIPYGQSFAATVVAHEPAGTTLLETPLGTVRTQLAAPLPVGNKVTLEMLPAPAPAAHTAAAPLPIPAPFTEIATQWTSLQQIAQLLAASPAPAQGGIPSLMPNASNAAVTPREISSGLLFFIAALKGGNFGNWLGADNLQWLQSNGHAALVKKAEAEFIGMSRAFSEPPVPGQAQQPWQALVFPFAAHGAWQQARIFVKRDRDQGKKQTEKTQGDTRFVVEFLLSQLGEMQLDGFVRKKPEATEFDLFIRSLTPLSQEIQRDILSIYNSTGELTGYRGSLVFQAVREFPVKPMEEIAEHMAGVIA